MEKRGGTTGVLNRRAGDRRERREIDARLRMNRETQGFGPSTQKTRMDTKSVKDTNVYVYINQRQTDNEVHEWLQPNRPANKCQCLFVSAKGEIGWRCCRKHTGVPQSTASLPKPARKRAVELWRMKEREASGFSPTALRPLYTRYPLSPRLPLFIEQEGSRLGINFLPTESNYLGSSYVLNSL